MVGFLVLYKLIWYNKVKSSYKEALMRKIFITVLVAVAILFFAWTYVKGEIEMDIEAEDLPQDVYQDQGDLFTTAQFQLLQIANPFSTEDEHTIVEKFMNYMLFYSIQENVNNLYDPLNETCEELECKVIKSTSFGDIEYAFMTLNDENQLVLTINFNRTDFLSFETAAIATFDIEIALLDMELIISLDSLYINDILISEEKIDWVLNQIDAAAIEDSIAIGELDLEAKEYRVGLLSALD